MARRKRKSGPGGARPGAGRKRVYEDLIYRTIGFESTTFEKLVRAAQKRGESVAAIVRRAVDTYLRRQKP